MSDFSDFFSVYEPPHDKTNKMACAPSEDSDQPGHPPSLIRVFTVGMKQGWVLSYPLSAQRKLIRLGGCPGWSESLLGAHAISLVLLLCGSYFSCSIWAVKRILHWYFVKRIAGNGELEKCTDENHIGSVNTNKRDLYKWHQKFVCNGNLSCTLQPSVLHEPRHEKTFLPYANKNGADQPALPRRLISAFVIRCLDSIIPLPAISRP